MTARRSALSVQILALGSLGVILSVATLVALGRVIFGPPATGTGFQAFGRNVLTITAPGTARALTNADADAIARSVPDIVALSRAVFGTASVGAGGQDGQTSVHGVDPSFAQVTSDTVAQGSFFTTQDAVSANRVAVLGQTLSSQLFQDGQTPVGATIRIRNVPFTVIGVLARQTSVLADNSDNAVLIPFQTGQVRLFGTNALDAVLVRVADPNQTDAVSQDVQQLLRQRRQLHAGQPDWFTIRTNRPPATTAGASQLAGQVVSLVRQYGCEAKGLCARS